MPQIPHHFLESYHSFASVETAWPCIAEIGIVVLSQTCTMTEGVFNGDVVRWPFIFQDKVGSDKRAYWGFPGEWLAFVVLILIFSDQNCQKSRDMRLGGAPGVG